MYWSPHPENYAIFIIETILNRMNVLKNKIFDFENEITAERWPGYYRSKKILGNLNDDLVISTMHRTVNVQHWNSSAHKNVRPCDSPCFGLDQFFDKIFVFECYQVEQIMSALPFRDARWLLHSYAVGLDMLVMLRECKFVSVNRHPRACKSHIVWVSVRLNGGLQNEWTKCQKFIHYLLDTSFWNIYVFI